MTPGVDLNLFLMPFKTAKNHLSAFMIIKGLVRVIQKYKL